jgi:hypothetical protein
VSTGAAYASKNSFQNELRDANTVLARFGSGLEAPQRVKRVGEVVDAAELGDDGGLMDLGPPVEADKHADGFVVGERVASFRCEF